MISRSPFNETLTGMCLLHATSNAPIPTAVLPRTVSTAVLSCDIEAATAFLEKIDGVLEGLLDLEVEPEKQQRGLS